MPRMKTRRGAAKRFRVTRTGKVLHRRSGLNHMLGKKTSRRKRRLGRLGEVGVDKKAILRLLGGR